MEGERFLTGAALCLAWLLHVAPTPAQTETPAPSATQVIGATETATPSLTITSTPLVLDFNPDLDHNGVLNAEDLLLYIRTWRVAGFIRPTPTPPFTTLTGIVSSASTGFGLSDAWVIAGTAAALSRQFGFYQLLSVRTDIGSMQVTKDEFELLELSYVPQHPALVLNPVLYPVGFPTFTPTTVPTETLTPSPSFSPTPNPSFSRTPTPVASPVSPTPTFTRTPTHTLTPTRTRTPRPTATPTVVELLGIWRGDLNPGGGGAVYNDTDITWEVTGAGAATASILNRTYSGGYTLSQAGAVFFAVTNENGTLELNMTWNGADGLSGTFFLSIPGIGQDEGPVVMSRTP